MNLKTFCIGLALSGLGVLSLGRQADAYSFNFLGSTASGSSTNYKFGFTASPGEVIAPGTSLTISGFQGISSLSFAVPVNNVAGTLFADSVFRVGSVSTPSGISNNGTTATFTSLSNINNIFGFVNYETFVISAIDVSTGEVNPDFGGNPLLPVAVPEPLTVLGALTAAGFGVAFKRRSLKSVK